MELEVKINATAKEVFDQLIKAVQQDIKYSTGKEVAVDKISEDYSYKKKLMSYVGKDVGVTVKIDKLVYPTQYSATFTNPNGKNSIEYNLIDSEDSVKIIYKESYVYTSKLQNLNYKIMEFIFSRSNKKKMMRNFSYLEKQILDNRNN